ncbi:ATP-binding protein [Rhodoferax sp. U2-2l]|uniref:AAA family ATPase n=1 Tax=Rhodoferax sp. U2-2l TaxID=2884000 RepID=UPI001D0AC051|nr:AAA family ATPase [Rhodoferax sp. U2-2l]MCB8749035.1 ATP-binding protein [Rhodoferax sp. U2-2l]
MDNNAQNCLLNALDQMVTNPLLGALPPMLDPLNLAKELRYRPITPEHIRAIPMAERHHLSNQYKRIFIPNSLTLDIAYSFQRMLHDGLSQRDPRQNLSRKFIYQSGQQVGAAMDKVVWWPSFASGMVIEGISGVGKSQVVDRTLSLFPQVIEHGKNEACGWLQLKQLVWLKVHMSSDGSRGGFLLNGLMALDEALQTDYASQYKGVRWTVEKLLVVFLHLLAVHRCGVLIIEEAQETNLNLTPFARDFINFFLRVLNWGIPTVLIGNPLAFSNLRAHSQDVDRFSDSGWFQLEPEMDPTSEHWQKGLIPGLWLPTLLDNPDATYTQFSDHSLDSTLHGFIWRRTAGFPRYVCRLRRAVQEFALRTKATQVTPAMIDEVYRTSAKMIPLHARIEAFVNKDWRALNQFLDISEDHYRRLWSPPGKTTTDNLSQQVDRPYVPKPIATTAKKNTSRSAAKPRATKANPTPPNQFSPEDIRSKEFQENMVNNMTKGLDLNLSKS